MHRFIEGRCAIVLMLPLDSTGVVEIPGYVLGDNDAPGSFAASYAVLVIQVVKSEWISATNVGIHAVIAIMMHKA